MAACQQNILLYDGTKCDSIQQLKILQKIRSPIVHVAAYMSDRSEKEKVVAATALSDYNRCQAGERERPAKLMQSFRQ